jgi:hypothetical protein
LEECASLAFCDIGKKLQVFPSDYTNSEFEIYCILRDDTVLVVDDRMGCVY